MGSMKIPFHLFCGRRHRNSPMARFYRTLISNIQIERRKSDGLARAYGHVRPGNDVQYTVYSLVVARTARESATLRHGTVDWPSGPRCPSHDTLTPRSGTIISAAMTPMLTGNATSTNRKRVGSPAACNVS